MANDVLGVVVGGAIGLLGGLGGVVAGQLLTARREARARQIDGIRIVVEELHNRSRLGLQIDQYLNVRLRTETPDQISLTAFDNPAWPGYTHELQERPWLFACMAYLPEALDDFYELDRQLSIVMDPYCEAPEDHSQPKRSDAVEAFGRVAAVIQEKARCRLSNLL